MGMLGANVRSGAASVLGFALALLAFYTSGFGLFDPGLHRALAMSAAAAAVLVLHPLRLGASDRAGKAAGVIDLCLLAVLAVGMVKLITIREALWTGLFEFSTLDLAAALASSLAILELARRALGLPLALFGLLALIYAAFGRQLPWIFHHVGFNTEQIAQTVWYSLDGVFGLPTGVGVNVVFIYIVFGAILEGSGAGAVLLKFAVRVSGHMRGGPAHAAIAASGLFGAMSGSAVANVVGTGVFTIPLMKKRGFRPAFAGAVETTASSGGQIMPPILGAAAFLLAELTHTPYLLVAVAALVPALLYYGSLFAAVGVEAARLGIRPTPKEEREALTKRDWLLSVMFVGPLAVLVGVLVSGQSAAAAGFWAALSALALPFLVNPEACRRPKAMLEAVANGGIAGARILIAVGAIGVLLAVINMTGIGLRFSNVILSLGDGDLFLSLVYTMLGALVLGMGLPTLPAYLIIVLVMGPALQDLGIPMLAAHMFVLYFGVLSVVTPPVALAAYSAAPIAGASPLRTGAIALRLATMGFVIPYMFVFHPSLLLVAGFDPADFLWAMLRIGAVIWLLVTGLGGFDRAALTPASRAVRLACCAALPYPAAAVQAAGLAAGAAVVAFDFVKSQKVEDNNPGGGSP